MAYPYYRTAPGWGTSQFQFNAPWVPTFQPQPSWQGFDFYNAHAVNPDRGFYNAIMSRAPEFQAMGASRSHCRYWNRLIYGGMVPLTQALSSDIGAAAAYEIYRAWKRNSFLYEPLSADRGQQREGLIAMAIAEATRLWQYSGRPADSYGLQGACEAAAAAASVLADLWMRTYAGYGAMQARGSPYMAGGSLSGSYAGTPLPGTPLSTASAVMPGAGASSLQPSPYMGNTVLPATYVVIRTDMGGITTTTTMGATTVARGA
ncbi:hypothetical protein C8Q73DRAFT_790061 [Cubamyces lactineus]|nr:hypothetical protein C8Q73DRAFT_790061 [Cubamyces lactineus]